MGLIYTTQSDEKSWRMLIVHDSRTQRSLLSKSALIQTLYTGLKLFPVHRLHLTPPYRVSRLGYTTPLVILQDNSWLCELIDLTARHFQIIWDPLSCFISNITTFTIYPFHPFESNNTAEWPSYLSSHPWVNSKWPPLWFSQYQACPSPLGHLSGTGPGGGGGEGRFVRNPLPRGEYLSIPLEAVYIVPLSIFHLKICLFR